MKMRAFEKFGAAVLVVGTVLAALSVVLELFVSPYNPYGAARAWDAPVHVLKFVAVLLVMFGLGAAYLRQAERVGALGLAGYLLMFLGLPLTALPHSVIEISLPPSLSQADAASAFNATLGSGPYLAIMSGLGFFAVLLGIILFAVATLRAKVLPRWSATISLVGLVVGFASAFLGGMLPGLVPHPPVFLLLGLAAYGIALLTGERAVAAAGPAQGRALETG